MSEPAKSAPAAPASTRAGGYFVANYPPFAAWNEAETEPAVARLDAPPRPDTALGVYLHLPFCRRRCRFCYFKVYTDKNAREIEAYVDALIAEAALYRERAIIGGRAPRFFYVGGGTPSYLSTRQLSRLFDGIDPLVQRGAALQELTFEAEPGTLSEQKLRDLRGLGVTRLSLGVENFSDEVLGRGGRAHDQSQVYRAWDRARAADFPQLNIDLIAGMEGESDANWADCIERTIALQPDSVTIYQMEIPFNTTIFKEMRARGEAVAPVADWPTKRRWVDEAFAALEAAGYALSSGYTAVREGAGARFVYRDSLWHGADLVPLGVSAFGHLSGAHLQNDKHIESYVRTVNSGQLPLMRGLVLDDNQRLIRELVLQLKLGRVRPAWFSERYGVDIYERFSAPLQALAEAGRAELGDEELRLSRDALLEVDSLLPAFFEAKFRA